MAASPSTPLVPAPVSSPSPSLSQPNATSNPPSPSNSSNTSASPPPQSTQSSAPPPISLPPPPLQISVSPPPKIPPIVSPPPPLTSPSPVSSPPSPPILSPPLPPPPGTPPSRQPPISTSPPPTLSPSPPSPPPQLAPPPIPIAPTLPSSPPSPSSAKPTSPIPVPPTPTPSTNSPAIPSSTPPPRTQPIATPPSSPTSSTSGTPKKPLPSPATPSGKLTPPVSPTPSNSSNSPPNDTTPSGNVNSGGSGGIGTGIVVAIGIIAFLVVLSFSILVAWVLKKKRRRGAVLGGGYVIPSAYGSPDMSDSSFLKTPPSSAPLFGKGSCGSELSFLPSEPGGLGYSRSLFTYEELLGATNGFSEQNLLGEGGFGPVYKGCLPDGREVAVKQLKVGGSQGEREFRAEVEIISRVHHRHLVSLVGYCISEHQRLLVYVYVPNSTLHYHVHGKGGPVLDWGARVKIAAGAARGIAYLHEDCQPRIIHRDIKSSNILLDKNFEAQVSDFGLAKLAQDSFTHVSTRVMGTFGYMAPEYVSSGKLTEKSDVFSFGVVLLELVTGREPVDASQSLGDESLVEWARPLLTQALDGGDFEGLVDPRLQTNYVKSELFRVMEVAAACVRYTAAKRPRMGQVVRALDSVADLFDLNNGMKPGQSELFNAAQQSAEIRLLQRMAFGAQDYSIDFSQTRSVDREI